MIPADFVDSDFHDEWSPDQSFHDITDGYKSLCDQPQLAHLVYRRLMAIAHAAAMVATSSATASPINRNDILLAAYTGTALYYRR